MSLQCGTASFTKHQRLLNAKQYSNVFDGPDARASHRNFLILAKRNDEPCHRLGLIIAKKNVRLAVQRNRIKRVIRESFRRLGSALPEANTQQSEEPMLDMIVMARRGIGELDNAELSSILQQQWPKLIRQVTKVSSPT